MYISSGSEAVHAASLVYPRHCVGTSRCALRVLPRQAPPIIRDAQGHLRAVGVEEEKTLSSADQKLFRREVKHRNSLFLDVD